KESQELPLLRSLAACNRVILGAILVLLVPLFLGAVSNSSPVTMPITSYGNTFSWNFGWGRPCTHLIFISVGMFFEYHPGVRWVCLAGLCQALALDTMASYDLHREITCVWDGRCALPKGYTRGGLRLAGMRDVASILFEVWALLLMAYLNLTIGQWKVRYAYRHLHGGGCKRVREMRQELAKHALK
ncbi:unnamed protein product, partial [Choristocarpus tenellus]